MLRESERDFESWVTGLLTLHNWVWYHTRDSRRSNEGFPDLVAVRMGDMVIAELKTEDGSVTDEQKVWFEEFRIVEQCAERTEGHGILEETFRPVRMFLWRPRDRPQIELVLR